MDHLKKKKIAALLSNALSLQSITQVKILGMTNGVFIISQFCRKFTSGPGLGISHLSRTKKKKKKENHITGHERQPGVNDDDSRLQSC